MPMNGLRDGNGWAHWLTGQLSSGERIWTAIAPALLLLTYVAAAGLCYALRNKWNGRFRDEEIATRVQGGLTSLGLRHFFAWLMRPPCRALARIQFPPDAITLLSLVIALGAALGIAAGRFALGGWLFVLAGVLDFLDGRLARSTGRASLRGAALDSVLDRYVEGALLTGLCWYYRDTWVLAPCLLALTGALLVPYVRARGEALGVSMADTGFMQRPERILLLGVGTALSPIIEVLVDPTDPHPPHRMTIAAVVLLGAGSHFTAIQRLSQLMQRLRPTVNASATAPVRLRARPLKSVVSNALATVLDFFVAASLFHGLSCGPAISTAVGCTMGAVTSFALTRGWTFDARTGQLFPQLARYVMVSLMTLGLNAGGVMLLLLLHLPFAVAWCAARAVVFVGWSYPLQRDYVFAPTLPPVPLARLADGEPSGVSRS
jgi:phosphatidylglycerophosphate synthase/putative flippase GtrA